MSEPRKRRFPKKKPVEELTDEEVLRRIFPKKVRDELERIAREERPRDVGENDQSDDA